MALPATSVHEVQSGGSDTLNGGHFDPANSNMATDGNAGTATGNSPTFSSLSYTFVPGDVGHWLFIKSGTNWIPGWYQIASVNTGIATLSAAIGAAVTYNPFGVSTAAGCATVASPAGATWSIDYSQGTTPVALTGLTTSGANAIILTASATKAMVGNGIFVTGGTNFTTGVYNILSVSAGVSATVDRTVASGVGAAGTGNVGGPFATPGFASGTAIASNAVFIKSGTYNCSSTADVASGRVLTKASQLWQGYGTLRPDRAAKPILQSTSNSMTLITTDSGQGVKSLINIEVKLGGVTTGIKGVDIQGWAFLEDMKATGCTNEGYSGSNLAAHHSIRCEANACNVGFHNGSNTQNVWEWCVAKDCTTTGFDMDTGSGIMNYCIAMDCVTGFKMNQFSQASYCIAYSGTTGFSIGTSSWLNSCVSYGNTTDYSVGSAFSMNVPSRLQSSAGVTIAGAGAVGVKRSFITLSADPFTDAAGGDFTLNSTAGGGALLRNTGYPTAFPGLSTATAPSVGPWIPTAGGTYTDPGIANVRSGTGYTYNSASLTGTCAVPAAGDVKLGVAVDNTVGTQANISSGGGGPVLGGGVLGGL